jgi:hypothetical protein
MNAIDEIRHLYYNATAATIQRDLARAVEVLKSLPDEEARERAAVFMDGLAQMRTEWALEQKKAGTTPTASPVAGAARPKRKRT